jgi:hypothetical protein
MDGCLDYGRNTGSVWMDVWVMNSTMAFADGCFDYGLTMDLCGWMLGLQCSKMALHRWMPWITLLIRLCMDGFLEHARLPTTSSKWHHVYILIATSSHTKQSTLI